MKFPAFLLWTIDILSTANAIPFFSVTRLTKRLDISCRITSTLKQAEELGRSRNKSRQLWR
jgi:hypothetical protein